MPYGSVTYCQISSKAMKESSLRMSSLSRYPTWLVGGHKDLQHVVLRGAATAGSAPASLRTGHTGGLKREY